MRKQRKRLKYNICTKSVTLLAILILTVSFVFPVYADTTNRLDLTVNQSIEVESGYSKPFFPIIYSLKAESFGAPLPDGEDGGVYNFVINGDSSKTLSIDFSLRGEYMYTIYQHKPKAELGYSHDTSVYRIYVSVNSTPSGLKVNKVLRIDGGEYKPIGIDFRNNFKPPDDENTDPPDDESNEPQDNENTEPQDNEKNKPPNKIINIKTGETSYLWTWLAISLTTALVFSLILFYRRRKRKDGPAIQKTD